MALQVISQPLGVDRDYSIPIQDQYGVPVVFAAGDVLTASIWSGDDTAILASPTCAWVNALTGNAKLSINASVVAAFTAGQYRLRIFVTPTSDSRKRVVWDGALLLAAAPGTAIAPPTYCTMKDMEILATWIGEVSDSNKDQTGFAEQRGQAREWLDDILIKRYSNQGAVFGFGAPWYGVPPYMPTGDYQSAYIRAALAANQLMVTSTTKRLTADYALFLICRSQVSPTKDSTFRELAADFFSAANCLVKSYVAEIDVNADGVADIVINIGMASCRN